MRRVHRIEQRQQGNFFSLVPQLLGHLIGNQTRRHNSRRSSTAREVAERRIAFTYRAAMSSIRRQRRTTSVQSLRLQSIERLVGTQILRKFSINQDVATSAVNAEKRRTRTVRLDRNQR